MITVQQNFRPSTKLSSRLFFLVFTDLKSCPIYPKFPTKIGIFGSSSLDSRACKISGSDCGKTWNCPTLKNNWGCPICPTRSILNHRTDGSLILPQKKKQQVRRWECEWRHNFLPIYLSLYLYISLYLSPSLFFSLYSLFLISSFQHFHWLLNNWKKALDR